MPLMKDDGILKCLKMILKTGCMLFNARCNEQVFSPKPWKKNWRRFVLSFSRKTQKTHTLIPKN